MNIVKFTVSVCFCNRIFTAVFLNFKLSLLNPFVIGIFHKFIKFRNRVCFAVLKYRTFTPITSNCRTNISLFRLSLFRLVYRDDFIFWIKLINDFFWADIQSTGIVSYLDVKIVLIKITLGIGFCVSHNLLNKWITVQLIFIDKLTVDYPCVLKLLTNNCGIYVVKLVVFLIKRCKLLIGKVHKVIER